MKIFDGINFFFWNKMFFENCCSATKSYPTLCDVMDHSTPGFPVLHYLLGVCSNSYPLSWWCHPNISSFVTSFSCLQSFPASGSFPMSQLFTSGDQSSGNQFQHQSFQWIFRIENCACMCAKVASVVSDSLWFYGLQPARLFCPWDSPGKNVVSHNCLDAFISASSNHVWREGLRFKKRSIIASDSSREGFHSPWKEDGRERNGNARKTLLSKKERLVDTQLGWGVAARKVIFLYDYILQKWHLLKNFVQKSYCMVVVGSMMKLWYGKHNDKRSETYREGRDKAPILWT